jgi:hypothetical protein
MSDRNRLIETEHGWVSVGMAKLYERPEPPLQIHGNGDAAAVEAERRKFHEFYLWRRARAERIMAEIEQTHGRAAAAASAAAGVSADVFRAFQKGLSDGKE